MPGYIMHLAEGKCIEDCMAERGIRFNKEEEMLFTAGLLLPDTKKKREKVTSHFWNPGDTDKLAIPPDLSLFLEQYENRLCEPLMFGYYAHLHLDRKFVTDFWPENFRFLNEAGEERVLRSEIKQVKLLLRGKTVPVDEFYSGRWYYGDYSRMNHWFQKRYALSVPVFSGFPDPHMSQVKGEELAFVLEDLSGLFERMEKSEKEPLRVFDEERLDQFLQDSARQFVDGQMEKYSG